MKNIPIELITTSLWIIAYIIDTHKNPKKMVVNLILGSFITFILMGLLVGLILKILDPTFQMNFGNIYNANQLFGSIGVFCALYMIYKYALKKQNK